jgi:hypothetical protein
MLSQMTMNSRRIIYSRWPKLRQYLDAYQGKSCSPLHTLEGSTGLLIGQLFKGFSIYFGKYETSLIKELMKKFQELKLADAENLRASLFCKAIFLLQEDYKQVIRKKKSTTNLNKSGKKASEMAAEAMAKLEKATPKNDELSKALEHEREDFLKTSGTLGRAALREENDYTNMYVLDTRDPASLMNLDRRELLRGKRLS